MSCNSKIIKRIVLGIEVKLFSPICVSSGADELTDNDLQRNFDGEIIIPGTSLAGAMRAYIKNADNLFGMTSDLEGKMSPLIVSDLYFEGKPVTSERDGVGLEEKVAKPTAKFNIEIVETGEIGTFRLCLNIREGEPEDKWKDSIRKIINGIQKREIRFGGKKNRGFGCFSITHLYVKEYTKKNVDEWIHYGNEENTVFSQTNIQKLEDWMKGSCNQFYSLEIPLYLEGGISIRKYAVVNSQNDDVDFEHVKSNGKSVIPGTSWAGAIRDRMCNILYEFHLTKERVDEIMNSWFGLVLNNKRDNKKFAAQSNIVFLESVIKGGNEIILTRNRVNRFDGSTIDGALYTEKGHFGGNTILEILVKKDSEECYKIFIGLLLLVIKDLQKGYLAVGGQTAVGRGIFTGDLHDIKYSIDGKTKKMNDHICKEYMVELRNFIREEVRNG